VSIQEPPSEDAIGRDRDTQAATGIQKLSLVSSFDKRVFDLEIHDRMNRRRASHRAGGNLRSRDVRT
jgi:hypothetical protein